MLVTAICRLAAAASLAIAVGCMHASAGELLPPDHGATDPEVGDKITLQPLTRRAIAMFDATDSSRRHYDLVDCLDGLTFAFGNEPQMQLFDFFSELREDNGGATFNVLLARLNEHFTSNPAGWKRFVAAAKLNADAAPDEDAIRQGLAATLLSTQFMKPYSKRFKNRMLSAEQCTSLGNNTARSFFNDHAAWFRPAFRFAFRDTDIVMFQVRRWERHYLARGVAAAAGLQLPPESGAILLTFIRSNPGQVPEPPRTTLLAGVAPASISIAGRSWRWDGTDRSAHTSAAGLIDWRQMLIWQVMCSGRDRIRSRNLVFFKEFLSPVFSLPVMAGELPAEKRTKENCDPARVRLH